MGASSTHTEDRALQTPVRFRSGQVVCYQSFARAQGGTREFASQGPTSTVPANITSYGRGAGVGRALGVGATLGVGEGLGVEVGVAVGVAVAVAVGVGLPVAVGVGVVLRSPAYRVPRLLKRRRCPVPRRPTRFR